MSYLGLTPSEILVGRAPAARRHHQRREHPRPARARRRRLGYRGTRPRLAALCSSVWKKLRREVQAIGWKAKVRLCKRYRQLIARGKHANQSLWPLPREMAAFAWAIARTSPAGPWRGKRI